MINFGTAASMGCVRMTVEDAKWIYDNCKSGTTVEFYSSENPGPLGKPEAMKITDPKTLQFYENNNSLNLDLTLFCSHSQNKAILIT